MESSRQERNQIGFFKIENASRYSDNFFSNTSREFLYGDTRLVLQLQFLDGFGTESLVNGTTISLLVLLDQILADGIELSLGSLEQFAQFLGGSGETETFDNNCTDLGSRVEQVDSCLGKDVLADSAVHLDNASAPSSALSNEADGLGLLVDLDDTNNTAGFTSIYYTFEPTILDEGLLQNWGRCIGILSRVPVEVEAVGVETANTLGTNNFANTSRREGVESNLG